VQGALQKTQFSGRACTFATLRPSKNRWSALKKTICQEGTCLLPSDPQE
jgi:hypothetical protein